MRLEDRSPSFSGTLRRMFPGEDYSIFQAAFGFALEHGGEEETDFSRSPGTSFNPRCARVPMILITDAGICDVDTIVVAILTSLQLPVSAYASLPLTTRQAKLLSLSTSSTEEILNLNDEDSTAVAHIVVANWLDRARHYHLADCRSRLSDTWFLEQTDNYLSLAETLTPKLAPYLQSWQNRFLEQHPELMQNEASSH